MGKELSRYLSYMGLNQYLLKDSEDYGGKSRRSLVFVKLLLRFSRR